MKDKVLDKIKKLMAVAESAGSIGNAAEAAAFSSKIKAMLDEHDLSMTDVEIHAAKSSNIEAEILTFINPLYKPEWMTVLIGTIAAVNGCVIAGNQSFMFIIGRKRDREVAISFAKYFHDLCLRLETEFRETRLDANGDPDLDAYFNDFGPAMSVSSFARLFGVGGPSLDEQTRSYMFGAVTAICSNLRSANKPAANSAALIYLNGRCGEAMTWIKETFGQDLPEMEFEPPAMDRDSFNAGRQAGGKLAITDKTLNTNDV